MKVLVPGATSVLGRLIADRLEEAGHEVTRTGRRAAAFEDVEKLDLTDQRAVRAVAKNHDAAILCPILSVSAPASRWLSEEGVSRQVVFSSNNVDVDRDSAVYAELRDAEAQLMAGAAKVTILRPTLIYGHVDDGNLARLMRFALRYGFLPRPGSGRARQQPVNVRDVARAAVLAFEPEMGPGPFTVAGPEAVSAKTLFEAVLKAAGKPVSVLPIPLAPLRVVARLSERTGIKLPLSSDQLNRFEADKLPSAPLLPGFTAAISLPQGLAALAAELAEGGTEG